MNARMPLAALLSFTITAAAPGAAYCGAFAKVRISAPVGVVPGFQAAAAHVRAPALAAPTLPGSASPSALSLPLPAGPAVRGITIPIAALAVRRASKSAASARPQGLPEQDLLGDIDANAKPTAPASGLWAEHLTAVGREMTRLAEFRNDSIRAAADWGRFFDRSGTRAAANGVATKAVLPAVKIPNLELTFNLSNEGYRVQPEHVDPFKRAWAGQSEGIIRFAAERFVAGGLKRLNREGSELFVYSSAERRGGAVIYAVKFVSKKGIYLGAGFYLTLEKNGRFTVRGDD